MHRLDRTVDPREGERLHTPLPPALVSERLRTPGGHVWLGWTVLDDDVVIAVSGDLCTASVPILLARLEELVLQYPARTVTIDLSRVDFADGRAVSMLVQLNRTCHTTGSVLEVSGTSRTVGRLLDMCGWTWPPNRRGGSGRGPVDGDGESITVRRHVDPIRN